MKTIKVTIGKDGAYTIRAHEGFAGGSCVNQTQTIEQLIGGSMVDEGKTDDYYKADEGTDVVKDIYGIL